MGHHARVGVVGPTREDTKRKSLLGQDLMNRLTDGRKRTLNQGLLAEEFVELNRSQDRFQFARLRRYTQKAGSHLEAGMGGVVGRSVINSTALS